MSKATRDAYGEVILELGKKNKDIVVVDCDIGKSCRTTNFKKELPDQYVNVGIAEQNACGVGAGLATTGKIPFVTTYAVFGSMRMVEQIRQEVAYTKLNVKIACSHGGLTPANDGASHQAIEDMGILRTIPGLTVIMPSDYYSARKLIEQSADYEGAVYLRFTRDPIPFVYDETHEFEIGKAYTHSEGDDVAIIANGDIMSFCQKAAAELEREGYSVSLIDMHTIKPLDTKVIIRELNHSGKIVTVEDHNIINGLGSAVAEVMAEEGIGKLKRMGVKDQFGESGPYEDLLADNGVTVEGIVETCRQLIGHDKDLRKIV